MSVVFKGFSIEVLNFGYTVNIQDAFRNKVPGANVRITAPDFVEEGMTDQQGCYFGNAEEGQTYTVTVSKDGFINYVHRFRIMPVGSLVFPVNNFPVLVYNASDAPVAGAQITITSSVHTSSGPTNGSGLFEGVVRADRENAITIARSGLTTYRQTVNPYIQITCAQTNLVAVPVVILT